MKTNLVLAGALCALMATGAEWDESWQPNVYSPARWARVAPVLRGHCAELKDPEVRRRRKDYAARDGSTAVEAIVRERVASGALPDPWRFSIDAVCAEEASGAPPGSGR